MQTTKIERREEWRKKVAEYQASGQSVAAWCAAQGIKPHMLYYWVKRFAPTAEPTNNTETQWLPISINDENRYKQPIRSGGLLVRVGNVVVEVIPGFNPQLLAEVVKALTQPC